MSELDACADFAELALGSYTSAFVDAEAAGAKLGGSSRSGGSGALPIAPPVVPGMKRYLCYFLHRYLEFRIPEIEALAETVAGGGGRGGRAPGPPPAVVWERPEAGLASPYWYAHLPSDEAVTQIAQTSMLAKVFLEVWGEGSDWEELFESIRAYPAHLKSPYEGEDQSFRFHVDCYGAKMQQEEQVAIIETFSWMAFKGPIDLKAPRHRFWVLIADSAARHCTNLLRLPRRIYFGREVAVTDRSVIPRYELRQRRYLGPTSMDTEMAFIMCNLGKVRRGSLVFDPFVGTGSILIAAAARGALTLGADIDMRVIKFGKKDKAGNPVNNWTNFADYGLPAPLGLLRADLHRHPFREGLEGVLDAIVCDPPYGVRAGGRKSVPKEGYHIADRSTHIVSTEEYSLGECLRDLLDLAARLLVLGGRLVYFLPAIPGVYSEGEIPSHPALQMVSNSEQILSSKYSRRLIAMEKVAAYDAAAAAAHHAALGPPRMAIDDLHAHVYAPAGSLGAASDAEGAAEGSGSEAGAGAGPPRRRHRGKQV